MWFAGNYMASSYNWSNSEYLQRRHQLHLPVCSGLGGGVSNFNILLCIRALWIY